MNERQGLRSRGKIKKTESKIETVRRGREVTQILK